MPVFASFESVSVSRRDPAQSLVLQVEMPSLGKSHCVSVSHAAKKRSIQSQPGMFQFYLR